MRGQTGIVLRRTLVLAVVLALVAPASAAPVLCRQRSGTLAVREAACRRREVATSSRSRANLTVPTSSHTTGATRPSTGVYRLTPDDAIDPSSNLGLVTADHPRSLGTSLVAYHLPGCPAGTFQVDTVDLDGNPSDAVAFVFVAF